jgi:Tfp pilus assembly protein PilO
VKRYFDRLNPAERRLVVVVGLIFFVVVNLVLVRPHFSDWGDLQKRLQNAQDTLRRHQLKILEANRLKPDMVSLEKAGNVEEEDQAFQLLRRVQGQALASGVTITSTPRQFTRTNEFFAEIYQPVTCQAGEKELVDFLFSLGSDESMIRVADLSVHPDPSRQRLDANIRLLASYQKKPAVAAKTAPVDKKSPAAAAPAKKP